MLQEPATRRRRSVPDVEDHHGLRATAEAPRLTRGAPAVVLRPERLRGHRSWPSIHRSLRSGVGDVVADAGRLSPRTGAGTSGGGGVADRGARRPTMSANPPQEAESDAGAEHSHADREGRREHHREPPVDVHAGTAVRVHDDDPVVAVLHRPGQPGGARRPLGVGHPEALGTGRRHDSGAGLVLGGETERHDLEVGHDVDVGTAR